MASKLSRPQETVHALREAVQKLSHAHYMAAEEEDGRKDLVGHTRDMIFALNSAVDTLADMIADEYNLWPYADEGEKDELKTS